VQANRERVVVDALQAGVLRYEGSPDTLREYSAPYAYQLKLGRKYTPPLHVDLGRGLLQLIDEVRRRQ
jgi:hypothetical protein